MPGLLKVGLTGGIACGRSTAAGFMKGPGWLVIDADRVTHGLLARGGDAVGRVVATFGAGVLSEEGGISRKALANVVFADAAARRRLERILHPLILGAIDADIEAFERRRGAGIVVVDAALMVETGTYTRYHRLIVAHCPPEAQRARLMARDRLTAEEADSRIAAQAPISSKMALADYLIDTGGTMAQTEANARRVAVLLEEDLNSLPVLPARRAGDAAC